MDTGYAVRSGVGYSGRLPEPEVLLKRRVLSVVLALLGAWSCPLWADSVDLADSPPAGLGDFSGGPTWDSELLDSAAPAVRPYVSAFRGSCFTEACFSDSASSHAQVHSLSQRSYTLGGSAWRAWPADDPDLSLIFGSLSVDPPSSSFLAGDR